VEDKNSFIVNKESLNFQVYWSSVQSGLYWADNETKLNQQFSVYPPVPSITAILLAVSKMKHANGHKVSMMINFMNLVTGMHRSAYCGRWWKYGRAQNI